MTNGSVKIVAFYEEGISASAAASRISTSEGTALDAYAKSGNREKDLKLIGKVLSSGHNTVIEHAQITVAFNNVSVLCEQLIIEHRLAAYTVKSRRYVDFTGAGYIIPENLGEDETAFKAHMDGLFNVYSHLLELEIPKEDARFVLPYCFRSNFIMTANAREFAYLAGTMTVGRLSAYPEMVYLGNMLTRQLEERFPGIMKAYTRKAPDAEPIFAPDTIENACEARQEVRLVASAPNAKALIEAALALEGKDASLKALVKSERPRALEMLSYTFKVSDVSLACVTHFTRHRIQSLIVPSPAHALKQNAYVLPESIRQNAEALKIYIRAFETNAAFARKFIDRPEIISYFALAGNTVDILFNMNARELLHFLRLRTCTRAQWEIRDAAREMLMLLTEEYPELFKFYGPSCAVLGYCPEGRLSCGKIQKAGE